MMGLMPLRSRGGLPWSDRFPRRHIAISSSGRSYSGPAWHGSRPYWRESTGRTVTGTPYSWDGILGDEGGYRKSGVYEEARDFFLGSSAGGFHRPRACG